MAITTNEQALQEMKDVQNQTKDALADIQQQLLETEAMGIATTGELIEQRYKTESLAIDADHLNAQLKKNLKLQGRYNAWKGNWFGMKRRAARAEAKEMNAATDRIVQKHVLESKRTKELEQNNNVKAAQYQIRLANYKEAGKGSDWCEGPIEVTYQEQQQQQKKRCFEGLREQDEYPLSPSTSYSSSSSSSSSSNVVPSSPPSPSPSPQSTLDSELQVGLYRVQHVDDIEIDEMLDDTSAILDRLSEMAISIGEETKHQTNVVNDIETTLNKAANKQSFASARLNKVCAVNSRGFLRSRRKSKKEASK